MGLVVGVVPGSVGLGFLCFTGWVVVAAAVGGIVCAGGTGPEGGVGLGGAFL